MICLNPACNRAKNEEKPETNPVEALSFSINCYNQKKYYICIYKLAVFLSFCTLGSYTTCPTDLLRNQQLYSHCYEHIIVFTA